MRIKKEYINNFFISGIIFGTISGIFTGFSTNFVMGILFGCLCGILFGLLLTIFVIIQSKKFEKISNKLYNNSILFQGSANHLLKTESVGGWLILTEKQIHFISHSFNISNHEIIIPIDQIENVQKHLTLAFIPNGLQIINKDGSKENFAIDNRKLWIKKIKETQCNRKQGN